MYSHCRFSLSIRQSHHTHTHPDHVGGDGIDMGVERSRGGSQVPQSLNVLLHGRHPVSEVLRETMVHLFKS